MATRLQFGIFKFNDSVFVGEGLRAGAIRFLSYTPHMLAVDSPVSHWLMTDYAILLADEQYNRLVVESSFHDAWR